MTTDLRPHWRLPATAAALLIITVALAFAPLRHAEFLSYDDGIYVTHNPLTPKGMTWEGAAWAATSTMFNWHPLTWLSHMLDCQLFGLDAGAHHLTSVALHGFNGALLAYVLLRLTGAFWPSLFTAALFALHPLHVEPVAWISARKDLLSTGFWFLALLGYVRFVERPTRRRMALVAAAMILSLLCKGMAVTLPLTLLLLDYWPLGRWPARGAPATAVWPLVREKAALWLIAAAGMAVQIAAQAAAEALRSFDEVPFALRAANALLSSVDYLGKAVWPTHLAIPYPMPLAFPPRWHLAVAAAVLVAISAFVVRAGRPRGYLLMGWLWYLLTLGPVIGLVQIGIQSMADRYTYVPLIGPFVAIAWAAADVARARPAWRPALSVAGGTALLACAALTHRQSTYWHDTLTLFEHTLAVTRDNFFAATNAAAALRAAGHEAAAHERYAEARALCEQALRANPDSAAAHNNLGMLLLDDGHVDAGERHLRAAVRLQPTFLGARLNLGALLLRRGAVAEAREHLAAAVAAHPASATAQAALGGALERDGKSVEALAAFQRSLQLDPLRAGAHADAARALHATGRLAEAIAAYREELRLYPGNGDAETGLGAALTDAGQPDEARRHFVAALRLDPNNAEAHNNLGVLLFEADDVADAARHFTEAVRLRPEYVEAFVHLGLARLRLGDANGAVQSFRAALDRDPANGTAQSGLAEARRRRGQAEAP